ncbi:TatD family hydrolase [Actomonas aquatica]|uniref:TatD family hydrolase n=1 Tax=Actomonas aquatica TaxID=2866162 RepID=A0ABZ1CEG9_9BACT|nr:TatD family hydrolase [Opitutus sp. WL0086]WRQ89692.1 TatD family hydrolase [Opitutus sp. WL0086]
MLFDAHNHLHFAELTPHFDAILDDLQAIGLAGAVVNGTHPDDDWADVNALADRYDWVLPSYGIHPWDVGQRPSDWQDKFTRQLSASPRSPVGEIGIDRWMTDSARPDHPLLQDVVRAPYAEQVEVFTWQLRWAAAHDRPATIHCLQAWGPLLEILRSSPLPARGFLLHAYGGSADMVPAFAELGAYFSYNTSFIDPRRAKTHAAFRSVPRDRLLVETDAPATPPPEPPYLLPSPTAGSRPLNHPANLVAAYAHLAQLRDHPLPDLTAQISANYHRLFLAL